MYFKGGWSRCPNYAYSITVISWTMSTDTEQLLFPSTFIGIYYGRDLESKTVSICWSLW